MANRSQSGTRGGASTHVVAPGTMRVRDLTTDDLLALVLDGRTEAYEEIVRRYQRDVLRIVSSLLTDRATTEDLVQQVFVNAYVALPRFELGRDFGPWLRTIARNAVREELRKRACRDRRLKPYGEILAARLSDPASSDLYEKTMLDALKQCVGRLRARAAAAIRHHYTEGKSLDEIAAETGSTNSAVRSLLCRVRVKLRECVERRMAER